MKKNKFTLIELLMVLVIISIIASIALPQVSRHKEKARRVACIANLRALALATNLYKDDEGLYPVAEAWLNDLRLIYPYLKNLDAYCTE